uniref:Spermatogenesis associated 9 n=1 Tax=Gorilla gorilla gorilla TaxID=9595 RepID=G3RIN7_GORGO
MPIKPVGWICGQVLKNFSGRIEGIQKAIMDLVDEFKDEFPTILRLSQSNQLFPKNLFKLKNNFLSKNSVHKICKSTRKMKHLKSFLFLQVRKGSLFEIISFPAKTALTSIIYASYAALIYLAVCVNAVLKKVKNILQEEESIRQNREESENCRKAFSEPVLSEPMFAEGEIKAKPYRSLPEKPDISDYPKLLANKQSNNIQVLHSVFDQSAEMNEQI